MTRNQRRQAARRTLIRTALAVLACILLLAVAR